MAVSARAADSNRSIHIDAPRDALVTAGALLALALVVVAIVPPTLLTGFFHDDSFFYIKTAQHIAEGGGSTFDGINRTNGYHPLYMFLLVGCAVLLPLAGESGIRAIVVLDTLVLAAALPFLDRFLYALGLRRLLRFVAITGVVITIGFYDFGVEGRLLLLVASLFLWLSTRVSTRLSRRDASSWKFAVIGALLCLVRVDAILFVGIVFGVVALLGPPPNALCSTGCRLPASCSCPQSPLSLATWPTTK